MDARAPSTFALYWGAWLLFGVFMATQDLMRWRSPLAAAIVLQILLLNLAQNLTWGVLSLGTLRVLRRFPLHAEPPTRNWLAHLLASLVIVPVGLALIALQAFALDWPKEGVLQGILRFTLIYASFEYLVCYWGVVAIHEVIQVLKRSQEGELQVARLEASLAQAQLQAIKVQLNPHFLFNTLNTLSALLHGEPARADRMLVKLSRFLRVSLEKDAEESTTLAQEIGLVEDYLDIERVRFDEALQVRVEVPEALREARVPAFLLQPVVENALKHGLGKRGGSLRIGAREDDGMLLLEVQDDGQGAAARESGTGIGLRNTRLRLERHYGPRQSLDLLFPEEGGALARIRLPLQVQASKPGPGSP